MVILACKKKDSLMHDDSEADGCVLPEESNDKEGVLQRVQNGHCTL